MRFVAESGWSYCKPEPIPAQKAPVIEDVSYGVMELVIMKRRERGIHTVAHVGAYLVQAVITHEDQKVIGILSSLELFAYGVDGRRGRG